jgi:hypothetical protein
MGSVFLEYDHGKRPSTKKYYPEPIIQVFHSGCEKGFWGESEKQR